MAHMTLQMLTLPKTNMQPQQSLSAPTLLQVEPYSRLGLRVLLPLLRVLGGNLGFKPLKL